MTRDYVQAQMWYSLAAARGLKIARENCTLLAEKMTPAQIVGRGGACLWKKEYGNRPREIWFIV